MKSLLLTALLAATCMDTIAAERANHFEAALSRASAANKDIVVFQRGSDWNPLSERLYQNVWLKPEVANSLPDNFVLVSIDQPEAGGSSTAKQLQQFAGLGTRLPPSDLTQIVSAGGASFVTRMDGSFVAKGANPAADTLTLKLTPKKAGALVRIDFLTSPSLPGNSAGRAANGNFAIQEVDAVIGGATLRPRAAWTSKHWETWGASHLVDGISNQPANFWNASAHEHEPRTLLIVLPQAAPAGKELQVRLYCSTQYAQHVPGCMQATVLNNAAMERAVVSIAEAEAQRASNAKFTWIGDDVPRIALLDREGRAVASFDNPRSDLTAESLVTLLNELQFKRIQRDDLWTAAAAAQGAGKAELLRQSLEVLGLANSPGHNNTYAFVHQQIRAADPSDQSGAQRWLQFSADPRDVPPLVANALALSAAQKFEEAIDVLNKELADPRNKILDADRLQRIMLGRFEVIRQWPGNEERRFEELQQIIELDPTTFHGIGATGYLHMHHRTPVPEYACYGWGANQVKAGTNDWKLKLSAGDQIDRAGLYRMRITHAGGNDPIKVERVELLEAGRIIFGSNVNAELSPKKAIETSLTVSSWNPAQKPNVRLVLNAAEGKTDCSGRVEFIPLLKGEEP